jgi:hypothetical protein
MRLVKVVAFTNHDHGGLGKLSRAGRKAGFSGLDPAFIGASGRPDHIVVRSSPPAGAGPVLQDRCHHAHEDL